MLHIARLLWERHFERQERERCPVCSRFVYDTVTLECGHFVCPACLKNKASASLCCALCWKFSRLRTRQADIVMYPEGEGWCETHREYQKLFCKHTGTLLCETCYESEDHRNHQHWPIAVAALESRTKILTLLKSYRRDLKNIKALRRRKKAFVTWGVIWTEFTSVVSAPFYRSCHVLFTDFSPKFLHLYYNAANEFLQYFRTLGLSQGHKCYNLSEDKRSCIIVFPDSSGETYTIYLSGSIEQAPDADIVNPYHDLRGYYPERYVTITSDLWLNAPLHG